MTDTSAKLALAARLEEVASHWAKSPDGAEWQRFTFSLSELDRNRILAALRSQPETGTMRADMIRRLRECNWNAAADMIENGTNR